jgi:hypothetical protein
MGLLLKQVVLTAYCLIRLCAHHVQCTNLVHPMNSKKKTLQRIKSHFVSYAVAERHRNVDGVNELCWKLNEKLMGLLSSQGAI